MSPCLDFFCQHMICMYAIIILRVRAGSLLGHRVDDQVLVPICCGGAHLAIDFLLIICLLHLFVFTKSFVCMFLKYREEHPVFW